ncbi:bifunctional diguanylate cyclase/phosphodiesterase [Methylocapsa sp. S129]|uniref:putative bifunctional diguanylate cyclase/phosphodiesterase n=1 Tax=Methylocapsa sp. S129 TaxID=1641869 RepID=UPI00131D9598|nr:EAL domain-containing protein [Methylocapsa sp. S129]
MPGYTAKVLAVADGRAPIATAPLPVSASFDLTIRCDGEQALEAIRAAIGQGQPFEFVVVEGSAASAPMVEQILSAAPDVVVIACVAPAAHRALLSLAERSDRLFVMSPMPEGEIARLVRALHRVRAAKRAPHEGAGWPSLSTHRSDGLANGDLERESERLRAKEAELAAGTEMLKATFDNMHQGFLMLDDEWRVRNFNSRLTELVGYPAGALREGVSAYDLIVAAATLGHYFGRGVEQAYEQWRKRLADRTPGEHLSRLSDGRTIEINYAPYGERGWIITYDDVSARVKAEQALAEQNERFDAALTNIPHGVCMFDADKRLILCNAGYRELYALPPELTLAGTPLQRILDYRAAIGNAPIEMATYFDVADEANAAGGARSTRVPLRDGRTVRIAHNPMSGGAYVATHEDITQAVRAEEQIRYMGSHDGLTGLPNRSLLRDRIGEAMARIRRGGMFCIHYLDLDNFKTVNDTHGHPIGDLLLKQVAERLRRCLRETDTLARLGGDEFVVLQDDIEKPEQAGSLARRFIEAMAEPFDLDGRQVYLGVSVGVSVCPGDGADVDTLLKNADMAMYRSKSEGRNTYRFFEFAMDARIQERRLLEMSLRRAVANEEFELYYQPQVDAQTEAITGCEALLRWNHPTRGMVPPAEFIPVAEEIGVIVPLGAWVIQQACREAATWPKHIGVAVNLSSAQFKGLTLVQTVVSALDASGLSPLRLELEITESALLANSESTIATLNHLRALGVRIAMDDFGTGYSSLSYLRSFPFDKIKIDRSFIKDLGEKGDCAAIVKAVASMGAALGMTTTAEGVETIEQLHQIRVHGCNEVQGYFFGRPCPARALPDLFQKKIAAA